MQGPQNTMTFTGWWCEEHGLVTTDKEGNCVKCHAPLKIVKTVILTERLYKDAWQTIVEEMTQAAKDQEKNNEQE